MAKPRKSNTTTQKEADALIISRDEFTQKLNDQIKVGEELFGREVTSHPMYSKLKEDFNLWDDYNAELIKQSFNNEDNQYYRDYTYYFGLSVAGGRETFQDIVNSLKADINKHLKRLKTLVIKVPLIKCEVDSPKSTALIDYNVPVGNDVFIVHGHDTALQQMVARTLETLGLNPIILSEQPNQGNTVIEKFEQHSSTSSFAIVLLTPDDEGKSIKDTVLQKRARQNVILELGYFIGKIGRKRVLPLYIEGVELPSDITGVVYTLVDVTKRWQFELVKELKAAGYAVDANKIL